MRRQKNVPRVAVYGRAGLVRAKCPKCLEIALVVDGEFQCCFAPFCDVPKKFEVMSSSYKIKRRGPTKREREYLIHKFGNRCFWCGRRFGMLYYRNDKWHRLKCHFDHFLPWATQPDNQIKNFIPACNVCNSTKSSRVFKNTEEAREWINAKVEKKSIYFKGEAVETAAMQNVSIKISDWKDGR